MQSTAGSATTANNRREQIGWYFYDWANSAFSTTVVTVFLGPYLTAVANSAADSAGFVQIFGVAVRAGAFFPAVVSLSVALQALFLPILGAIADYSQLKRRLLGIFAYLGAFATMGLYFVQGSNFLLGGLLFLLANLSFGASIVFYNAFLPEIARVDERDRVSSQGWALGYLGGGLLLALNLVLFAGREALGVSDGLAVRISLVSAGLWWAIFTLIPLATLRQRQSIKQLHRGENYLTTGFRQLGHTLRQMPRYPHTLLFLVAYLLYNDGIQAVITLSAQFGSEELRLDQQILISTILLVQFVAFFGALFFGWLAQRIGVKQAIILSLIIWTGVIIATYALVQPEQPVQFYVLGAFIATVLGGSQALSRSLFSQMIPPGQEAEYFSLYEVSERGTSWLGPAIFALAYQFTGSYRISILSIIVLFVLGLAVLTRVNVRRAIAEAGNQLPDPVPNRENR
jgi:UMF1 family MFS transporter